MQTPLEFAVQYRAGYFTAYHTVIQEAATDTARYPDNGILGHIQMKMYVIGMFRRTFTSMKKDKTAIGIANEPMIITEGIK